MSNEELVRGALVEVARPMTAIEIRAQVNLIQEVMAAVMQGPSKEHPGGVHYGRIPGTEKQTLYKAGSEKILSTFRIAVDPIVEDLSTPDEARYRVTARGVAQSGGTFLGSGIGEASSNEEKYRWRRILCEQEFNETPEDRRRIVWKRAGKELYQVKQVRINHADVANTILKMAKKRAQIDMTLTVTAASDIFTQDIEDLPEELQEEIGEDVKGKPAIQQPQPVAAAPAGAPPNGTPPPATAAPAGNPDEIPNCKCGQPASEWRKAGKVRFYCAKDRDDPTKCDFRRDIV